VVDVLIIVRVTGVGMLAGGGFGVVFGVLLVVLPLLD